MEDWQKFERKVVDYLNEKFSLDGLYFYRREGNYSSNQSDIIVERGGRTLFNLDVKCPGAQAGQFVVEATAEAFSFKPNRERPKSTAAQERIIAFLNENFEKYGSLSGSKTIDCDPQLVFELIKEHYELKEVKYFMTSKHLERDFRIIPIDLLDECFDAKATLRRKASGSRRISNKMFIEHQAKIEAHMRKLGIHKFEFDDAKKRYYTPLRLDALDLKRKQLYVDESIYLSRNKSYLDVKALSPTRNPTIIYSLEYNGQFDEKWKIAFVRSLFPEEDKIAA